MKHVTTSKVPHRNLARQLLATTTNSDQNTRRGCEHRKSDSRANGRFKYDTKEKTERRAEKSTQVSLLLSEWVSR